MSTLYDPKWLANIASQVGRSVEALRELRSVATPNALARATGLNYHTIRSWEDGSRTPSVAAALIMTDYFQLTSIEELLAGRAYLAALPQHAAQGTTQMMRLGYGPLSE